ncbi:MAG: hypothetical protein K5897_08775 [Eubacterium sp.]|nr:hypothetical protein [Eubacterium sp.]
MDENNMNPYGDQPTNGAAQGTPFSQGNPYGGQPQQNPYGGQPQGNPYGGQPQQNPYGGQPQANPYGGQSQGNPYGGQPQGNPYGGQPQQNPYGGQPQANPYGGQSQGGASPYAQPGTNPYAAASAPYGTGATPTPPKAPKKKMPGWAKALIFGGIGAAILGVGLYFLLTLVVFPAKKTLDAAYDNSFKVEEMASTPLVKELGVKSLSENIKQSGGYFSFEVGLGSLGGEKTKGSSMKGEGLIDKGAKQLSAEGYLLQDGKSIVEADFYADADQTYITIQDLMNGYLAFSNKNIISGIKNSPLLDDKTKQALAVLPDISLDYFGDGPLISGLTGITGGSDGNSILSELWEQSKVSRAGSEDIYIGTDTINAKKFEVTIPKEAIQDAIGKLMDQAVASLGDGAYDEYLQQAGITSSQLKQYVDQYRSIIKSMITEDFKYYSYVYDEKVVSIKSEGTLKLSGVAINYDFGLITYSDDEKTVLSLKASLNVMGQKIELSGSVNSKKTGEGYVTDIEGSLTLAGTNYMGLSYSQTYNPSTKKITGSGSLQVEGSTALTVSIEGEVTELTQGKSISLDLSKIKVRSDRAEFETSLKATISTLDASGKSVKPLDSSKKVVNVMTASKDEIKTVIDEDSEEYKKFMDTLDEFLKSH